MSNTQTIQLPNIQIEEIWSETLEGRINEALQIDKKDRLVYLELPPTIPQDARSGYDRDKQVKYYKKGHAKTKIITTYRGTSTPPKTCPNGHTHGRQTTFPISQVTIEAPDSTDITGITDYFEQLAFANTPRYDAEVVFRFKSGAKLVRSRQITNGG